MPALSIWLMFMMYSYLDSCVRLPGKINCPYAVRIVALSITTNHADDGNSIKS